MIRNILSIDVEEVFHGEYTRQRAAGQEYRSSKNIPIVLRILKTQGISATFFVVGEIAAMFPEIIGMILEEGHEIAFHGWSHIPLWKSNPEVFRREIIRFKEVYPRCVGHRAASFSLNQDTSWALEVLLEEGFHYDSSIFPAWAPLYGIYGAPTRPYNPSPADIKLESPKHDGLMEFPLAVSTAMGIRIPIAGGFWLRLWDVSLIKKGIRRMNHWGIPAVIYVHTWELDPTTPRLALDGVARFITYHNIGKVLERLLALLRDLRFESFSNYMNEDAV
jgi:polysaccharide deacetylase family protein (PEP-CTERM system associated)